ncbi:hypothetical protein AZI86_10525 [Bdellovibrio bacteriovorus]|uniref:thioredoxin-dependent peroxiredoxin n=1 Tax=Bdellovibrio bacteriovorus TaxID=959 RepID=A0A150WL71_BDEBC|nr:peroxiredoxin [Bdellovibrio bacteriovorus]KYG64642.1 hypothetical protein AZI86_10525 [Bdellovibrio bacteriovorus]
MKNIILTTLFSSLLATSVFAKDLAVGSTAPLFKATLHDGKSFDLRQRRGSWTVLYFYPKAGTPGCTKQACAFRDSIDIIRKEGAEVYGLSADTKEAQAAFHKEHNLNFSLIADPQGEVVKMYGSQMEGKEMSKRWTFILDPALKIRAIEKDVDPALDAERVAKKIAELKK